MKIVGLDLETTGIGEEHKIIEYCGIVQENGKEIEFDSILQRFNPKRSIDPKAEAVHHISLADLVSEPTFESKAKEIHEQLKNASLIIIHNASFDTSFLNREFQRLGLAPVTTYTLCTMRSSRWATFDGKVPRLEELCFALDIEYDKEQAHGARYDVEVMLKCFNKIIKMRNLSFKEYILPFNQITEEAYLKADGLSLN